VVRHVSSVKSNKAEQPPEWPDQVHAMTTLPALAGMNRFVWDIRYDDPVQIPGAFYAGLPPRGPIVLPGSYSVRLSYEGQTYTVPLTIERDPRVSGSSAGLEQKFALSMEVYHDQDALHRAVNDIRALKGKVAAALKAASGKPQSAGLAAEGNALAAQASKIERELMQVDIQGSEANLNFPGKLNEQMYSFSLLLEDADTAPNAQEVETYAALHAKLGTQLAAWNALQPQAGTFCAHAQSVNPGDSSTRVCP
jgi:hypothetical protein